MKGGLEAFSQRFVGWLIQHRWRVLASALVVVLVGGVLMARLYGDLRSEVEELLPSDAPSVVAAKVLQPRLYDVNHLSVVLQGNDGDALERFADALAARLRALPPTMVQSVDYRVDEERAFLQRFGLFFLSAEDLRTILQRVKARLKWEREYAVAVNLTDEQPPSIDFKDIEAHYSSGPASIDRFRNGYFQTPDGKLLALLVRPPRTSTGYKANLELLARVRAEVKALNPQSYDATLVVGYDGEVAALVEEQQALREDLVTSGLVVIAGVTGVLWLFFRRWRAIFSLFLSVAAGTLITFGLAELFIGHLNANTAFLGSIVIGNGINAAIIFMGRYMEERRTHPMEHALPLAWRETLPPTFVASFSAGLAYLSLAVTRFRGFNQFGVIGGLGMAFCWLAAYLLLPPLLAAFESRRPLDFSNVHRSTPIMSPLVRLLERHRRPVQVLCVLLSVGSVVAILSYRGELVEYDFNKLRARHSQTSGSIFWGKKVDQVFQAYLTPIAIVGNTPEDLQKVVDTLNAKQKAMGAEAPLREVRTARTVLPADADAKVPLLRELRDAVPAARLAELPEDIRKKAERYRPPEDPRPPRWEDLPRTLRMPLTERDGTVGRVALAYPARVGSIDAKYGRLLTDTIRGAIQESGANAMAVGRPLLFADIGQAILRDGPRATLLALCAVSLLVLVVLRQVRPAFTVLSGLLMGVLWLVGLAAAVRLRINFLNFVVLPITFGIGVDYAVNIVLRYRETGPGTLSRVIRETGGAVALCSSTTIIGYASLIVSDNQALAGFGMLASVGEVACLSAALLALPALFLEPKEVRETHAQPQPPA